jgi:hypothetical protein
MLAVIRGRLRLVRVSLLLLKGTHCTCPIWRKYILGRWLCCGDCWYSQERVVKNVIMDHILFLEVNICFSY